MKRNKKHYMVVDHNTGKILEGKPSSELVTQSLKTDNGACYACWHENKWDFVLPQWLDFYVSKGAKVVAVFVEQRFVHTTKSKWQIAE